MAALRVAALLDADPGVLSFEGIYHALKEPAVQAAPLQEQELKRGIDASSSSRADLIQQYLRAYAEIDWKVHGCLTHFRINLGIAHLALNEMTKSTTMGS